MQQQFVPYELALILRVLGFNEEVLGFYWMDTRQLVFSDPDSVKRHNGVHLQAPTWQQAFDWFREKKGYRVSMWVDAEAEEPTYSYEVFAHTQFIFETEDYLPYEEARFECLHEIIKFEQTKPSHL